MNDFENIASIYQSDIIWADFNSSAKQPNIFHLKRKMLLFLLLKSI